jgi:Ca-activated chloride channel homolog
VKFLWPEMLWLGLLLPLSVLVYVWLLKRRKAATLRFANLSLIKDALGAGGRW